MVVTLEAVRVGKLEEVKQKGYVVVSMDRPVAVFYHDGKLFAVDNRCPHMGFPLHRGSVKDGILTCYWHHARFDLASGCTFDLFADDVASHPVQIRDGDVWLLPRQPTEEVAKWKRRLVEGMEQDLNLVMAKSTINLLSHDVDPREIVRQASLFGARYRDGWADGLTILTAMSNLLPYLKPEEKLLPLWHGIVRVANNISEQSPRWDRQPLIRQEIPVDTFKRWLRHWTLVRHRDGAERCLLTAISSGVSPREIADTLVAAATDRIFADGGHLLDFLNKAFELLEHIGWENASVILPTLVRQLVGSRGGEESSMWRQPADLVSMLQQLEHELPQLTMEGGKKTFRSFEASLLIEVLLGDSPQRIMEELKDSIRRGVRPVDLSKAVAYAAAMRICRFGTANEFGDWVTVLHTFSYCNAMHQTIKRISEGATENPASLASGPSPEVLRGIYHGALSVYLDRFLNMPPAALPGERESLDDEPTAPQELLNKFLQTLDRQAQVNEAGRIVARYLTLGHSVEALIRTLTQAVVREDAEFHTYQMLEASVRQYKEWRGTKRGEHILIAAARYIAAHSPTQREMLQTADIALRLHRGEELNKENA